MTEDTTREDRRSALDDFANSVSTEQSTGGAMVPAAMGAQPTNLVFGAQAVAVHRDETKVLAKLRALAAAAGSDWYYRFPVRDKGGKTSWIEGPSIKLANDIARLYGNCEVDCRAQDFGSAIMFHARFVDLESGYALTRPFQQRKGASRLGGDDQGRRDDITFQIGASKAIRNVVVNALQTFADFAFEEAKQALVEKIGKALPRWRDDTVQNLKVDVRRVEAIIGRPAADWLAQDVARVRAMGKAIQDGMATWDETFPPLMTADNDNALDKFAADERSMVEGDGAGVGVAASSSAPTAAETEAPEGLAAVDPRPAIIARLFEIAAAKTGEQERLEVLDEVYASLLANHGEHAAFIKTAAGTMANVIKGGQPAGVARKYLEGLIK